MGNKKKKIKKRYIVIKIIAKRNLKS